MPTERAEFRALVSPALSIARSQRGARRLLIAKVSLMIFVAADAVIKVKRARLPRSIVCSGVEVAVSGPFDGNEITRDAGFPQRRVQPDDLVVRN